MILASTLFSGCSPVVQADSDEIKVFVNGKRVKFDVQPFEDWNAGGRVIVQVRPVVQAMGCKKAEFFPKIGRSWK